MQCWRVVPRTGGWHLLRIVVQSTAETSLKLNSHRETVVRRLNNTFFPKRPGRYHAIVSATKDQLKNMQAFKYN